MKPKLQHHAVNKKGQCGFKRNLENASSLKDQEFDSFFPPPHLRTFKVPAHARRTTSASACLPYRTETERCENFQKHILVLNPVLPVCNLCLSPVITQCYPACAVCRHPRYCVSCSLYYLEFLMTASAEPLP